MTFRLQLFRPLWGVIKSADGPLTFPEALSKVKALGYSGIECPIATALDVGKKDFKALLDDHGLKWIAMAFTDGPVAPGFSGRHRHHPEPEPGNVKRHLECLQAQVEEALDLYPVKINSHTGNDWMTQKQKEELFAGCVRFEKQVPVPVMHETHRKRALYSPWVVRDLLPSFPELKLVADLSHFLCVAETNPQDPVLTAVIEQIKGQVYHIHGRVGYDHGPQVPDPRDPLWKDYVAGHEAWWLSIFGSMKERGFGDGKGQVPVTFSPEHGPPSYQICHPNTTPPRPLANIWEVNTYIGERTRAAFSKHF